MLTLIAESKTMLAKESDVTPQEYEAHKPVGETLADEIMATLKELPVNELVEQTGLSSTLAVKMKKMAYEFAFKATGNAAITSYTGVVFKALDYASLDAEARQRCNEEVGLISSLYGWLRPDDIIKPYRLDFNSKPEGNPVEGKALNAFWKADVTKQIVKTIQSQGITEILNLLPSDASKCVDWKLVKRFAKVWKVDFQEMQEGGKLKTPTANRLKTLRGTLLRQILEEDIRDSRGVMHTVSPHYVCEGTPVYPDHLQFLC